MNELTTRALTGAVYVALTVGAAFVGPTTAFLLFLPVCIIAGRELHRLYHHGSDNTDPAWYMVLAGLGFVAVGGAGLWHFSVATTIGILALLVFVHATAVLLRNPAHPATDLAGGVLVLAYVALPFGTITHLIAFGPEVFVGFMVLLWTNDTGAYLVGRTVGRTPLMPAISPKKTIEGLVGGVLLTLLAAWAIQRAWPTLSLAQWLGGALAVSLTSTIGDLLESALKRAAGVKDSGKVLPGHGGILDRFDGFILAAPAMLLGLLLLA